MTVKDKNNIPKLVADIDNITTRVATKVGTYMEQKIVDMMIKQDPSWEKLKPATIAAKGSTKIYIDTGELMELIDHVVKGGKTKVINVGIFNHEKAYIAHIIEFGKDEHNVTMRGRPLFRLVFDLERENIIRLIESELEQELQRFVV